MSADLPGIVDSFRWRKAPPGLAPAPAIAQYLADPHHREFVSGSQVAETYGPLLHFTSSSALDEIKRTGKLGNPGVYLTPTPYAGWQASSELGLADLFDRCLVVDVSDAPKLWGPGRARPSAVIPGWPGGGMEFWTPEPIPYARVTQVFECSADRAHRRIAV